MGKVLTQKFDFLLYGVPTVLKTVGGSRGGGPICSVVYLRVPFYYLTLVRLDKEVRVFRV